MTHRPYPNPDRARHQLDRHEHYEDVPVVTLSPAAARLMTGMVEAVRGIHIPTPRPRPTPTPSDPGSGG